MFRRTTRDCSLQATHALLPSSASVIVGQNGPAAAHAFTVLAPGTEPSAAADAVDVISAAAITAEEIFTVASLEALTAGSRSVAARIRSCEVLIDDSHATPFARNVSR